MRRWRLALALGEWLDSAGDDGLNLVHYNAMLSVRAGRHGRPGRLSQMDARHRAGPAVVRHRRPGV